eukprot:757581-Prymnesium_polylepis.2
MFVHQVDLSLGALGPEGHGLHVLERRLIWAVLRLLLARVYRLAGRAVPEVREVAEWDRDRPKRADGRGYAGLVALRVERPSGRLGGAERDLEALVAGEVLGDDCEALAA